MDEKIFIKEAIKSDDGQRIIKECQKFMVELSTHHNCNAEWLKGIGLLISHLADYDKEIDRLYNCKK